LGIGIWQIVLVVIFIGTPCILAWTSVKRENSGNRISRARFAAWVFIPLTIVVFMAFVSGLGTIGSPQGLKSISSASILIAWYALSYPFFKRVVQRARDINYSKAIAFWTIVPFVNIFTILFLLLKKSSNSDALDDTLTVEKNFYPPQNNTDENTSSPLLENREDGPNSPKTQHFVTSNYFIRHWRGQLSLGISYWANGVLVALIMAVGIRALISMQLMHEDFPKWAALFLVFALFDIVVHVWLMVGIWRSATKHTEETNETFWATAAKFMVIVGILQTVVSYGDQREIFKDFANFAFGNDKYGKYQVKVIDQGQTLVIEGHIGFGLRDEVRRKFETHPNISTVILNSLGGRTAEARNLRNLLFAHGIKKIKSEKYCASACTIAFMAGHTRILSNQAWMGFHQYIFPKYVENSVATSQMEIDKKFLIGRNIAKKFVDRAYSTPNKDMWRPTKIQLLKARVITNVEINGSRLNGKEYVNFRWKKSEEILLRQRFYKYLKQLDKKEYARLRAVTIKAIVAEAKTSEYSALLKPFITRAVKKYVSGASDKTLSNFTKVLIDQLNILNKLDPKLCLAYVLPIKGANVSVAKYFPKKLQENERNVYAELLLDHGKYRNLKLSDQQVSKYLFPILIKSARQNNMKLSGFENPRSNRTAEKKFCSATIDLYQNIYALPPNIRYRALRSMLSN
jgi:hypothetical protein